MFAGKYLNMEFERVKIDRDIKVITVNAESFPMGVMQAHQEIHKIFPNHHEKRYFGISWMGKNNEIVYYAAAEELYPYVKKNIGFETFTILKGEYYGKVLKNWKSAPNLIGDTFKELLKFPELDPDGYCLEIYMNESDIQCLVKLRD